MSDLCNDVKFSVFNDDPVLDLLSISLAKCVICSASSFSMFGVYLNKNNDCVVTFPYYKYDKWFVNGEKIVPDFAKREKNKRVIYRSPFCIEVSNDSFSKQKSLSQKY